MAISLSQIQSAWGGSNPIGLNEYYQGGSLIGQGVKGGSISRSGTINLNGFNGVTQTYGYSYNQRTSGDQSNDGCAWAAEYLNGGSGWGLYITVAYYGPGSAISYTNYTAYGYVSQFKINVLNSNVNGTSIYGNGNGESGYMGVPYGNIDSSNILTVYGNNGSGSPGDSGYAYATANNRSNWSAMTSGTNYFQVQLG